MSLVGFPGCVVIHCLTYLLFDNKWHESDVHSGFIMVG